MKDGIDVSIIIPAYNEAGSIQSVIESIQTACADLAYEIIVVDDGSIDQTGNIAAGCGAVVVRNPQNIGYGGAIKAGVRAAKAGLICITDADGTYPSDRIPGLVRIVLSGQAEMAVGARPWGKIPFSRRLAKLTIHKLSEFLLEQKVPDMNSGLRVFRKDIFVNFLNILPDGFSLTSTITLAFLFYGHRVQFENIDYYKRVGSSKIHPIKDTLNFVRLILRTTLYFNPLKIFLPVSLLFLGAGILISLVEVILFQNITTLAVLICMGGVNLFAIGVLADFINLKSK